MYKKKRTTAILGAGAVLDFSFPKDIMFPSTSNITKEVCKPYVKHDLLDDNMIPQQIYDHLLANYPKDVNPWVSEAENKPYIHFEMIFHVMESYLAYERAWSGRCKNSAIYPVFGPFTGATRLYDVRKLHSIMDEYIMRIMRIVEQYDSYYRCNPPSEQWYHDFFAKSPLRWDVFNFNYDTTIEHSLQDYVDGFVDIPGETFKKFDPKSLWYHDSNLSTINHLHGCIHYFYERYKDRAQESTAYKLHDLYKYDSTEKVLDMMHGTGMSHPHDQSGEEYYAGPIITGLKKNDKLNCIPYDFYHGYLYNSIMASPSLFIAGYSFGDFYANNLIDRFDAIHGSQKRVVVIDKWNEKKIAEFGIDKYLEYSVSHNEIAFMLRMAGLSDVHELIRDLNMPKHTRPKRMLRSSNGCLMIGVSGFKAASVHSAEIYNFLNKR